MTIYQRATQVWSSEAMNVKVGFARGFTGVSGCPTTPSKSRGANSWMRSL